MHIKRSDNGWLRKVGFGGVAAGLLLAITGVVITPVSADPPGNNGTIKVDEQGLENGPGAPNSNDPHIDCVGRVEWYGFDPGVQESDVFFEVVPPTSNTGAPGADTVKEYLDVQITDTDGPGGTSLDGVLDFDLTDLLANFTPHPQQGYHVKVTAHTTFSQGNDTKSKVFWVGPCPIPTGSLSVDKAVDGNDPQDPDVEFDFTVECALNGQPVDLNGNGPGTAASFALTAGQAPNVLSDIPAGASCTVTETDGQGADATAMRVGGTTTPGNTVSGIIVGDGTTVSVLATNTFNTTTPTPTIGSLSIDKDVNGDDPQDPALTFIFAVTCTSNGQPVDLNGAKVAGDTATITVTEGDPAEVLSGIPTGATCSVTETEDRDADATAMTVGNGAAVPGTTVTGIVIGNGTTIAVLATNTFTAPNQNPTGSLSVDKALEGNDLPAPGTQFTFTVDCDQNGQAIDLNGGDAGTQAVFNLTAGQGVQLFSGLPAGATCDISETGSQGADATTMTVGGNAPVNGTTVLNVPIGNGTTVSVLATNTFNSTTGGGGGGPGGGGPGGGNQPPPPPIVLPTSPVVPPTPPTPPVVDECPDMDGIQDNPDQCEVEVLPTAPIERPVTPEAPVAPEVTPVARPTASVQGAVVNRPTQLPRTGESALPLVEVGFGLVLLGAGAVLFGRDRTAAI